MLQRTFFALTALLLSTAHGAASYGRVPPTTGQVTYTNSRRLLFDTNGNQIDAYGSKISFFNGKYYLYGNSFSTTGIAFGIKSYSSNDLEHWSYEGFLFDPNSQTPCNDLGGCGRPHIIYNKKTKLYVLWANAGTHGYPVATSSSPSGPFTFRQDRGILDPQFDGLQPADHSVETIGDKAYVTFSALNFVDPRAGNLWPLIYQTLHISELTSDYTNTTGISYPISSAAFDLIDQQAESNDLFYRNGLYYIAASNTCAYCNGTLGLLYRSKSIKGPWTRQILSGYSCNGQVEGVLPLTDPHTGKTEYVWHSTSVPGGPRVAFGGHIFQPLQFLEDGSAKPLDCSADARFTVAFTPGSGSASSGLATKAVDTTPPDAVYTPVCDSDSFDLYQTWKATKSGQLKSVSVNIARASQTVPLALTVFKFDSHADLVAPEYKWTLLGNATFNATSLSYALDTVSVPITSNATVNPGDLLGLAVLGTDFTPYCHLEFDLTKSESEAGFVLYQKASGHNSWRGLKGFISPIYARQGKSIKFLATYV